MCRARRDPAPYMGLLGAQLATVLPSGPASLACWACLGLSTACLGLRTACPWPQDCLSWASGRPSGLLKDDLSTGKTATSSNVRLKNAQTAAKSLRTP